MNITPSFRLSTLSQRIVFIPAQTRCLHSRRSLSTQLTAAQIPSEVVHSDAPLARLRTSSLLRTWFLGKVLGSPLLYKPGIACLRFIANSRSPFVNPDRNPILRAVLKPLVYDQFCAGTNEHEVRQTVADIKRQGYTGVILTYAREASAENNAKRAAVRDAEDQNRTQQWLEKNLQTIDMMEPGDILGIKITGAGKAVADALVHQTHFPDYFRSAMHLICQTAKTKSCRLWIDAEHSAAQDWIDSLAVDLMRAYNTGPEPVVYNTIQAYLKDSRSRLQHQLRLAVDEGWTLGVKLVRGAYLTTDPRERIHDTKEDTDASYNGIARDIMQGTLPGSPLWSRGRPPLDLCLAGHNSESIRTLSELARKLSARNSLKASVEFSQLQGMADDIGCELLQSAGRQSTAAYSHADLYTSWTPRVYKYLTWGSVQECMLYLARRAVENQGATDRMLPPAQIFAELKRRMFAMMGRSS